MAPPWPPQYPPILLLAMAFLWGTTLVKSQSVPLPASQAPLPLLKIPPYLDASGCQQERTETYQLLLCVNLDKLQHGMLIQGKPYAWVEGTLTNAGNTGICNIIFDSETMSGLARAVPAYLPYYPPSSVLKPGQSIDFAFQLPASKDGFAPMVSLKDDLTVCRMPDGTPVKLTIFDGIPGWWKDKIANNNSGGGFDFAAAISTFLTKLGGGPAKTTTATTTSTASKAAAIKPNATSPATTANTATNAKGSNLFPLVGKSSPSTTPPPSQIQGSVGAPTASTNSDSSSSSTQDSSSSSSSSSGSGSSSSDSSSGSDSGIVGETKDVMEAKVNNLLDMLRGRTSPKLVPTPTMPPTTTSTGEGTPSASAVNIIAKSLSILEKPKITQGFGSNKFSKAATSSSLASSPGSSTPPSQAVTSTSGASNSTRPSNSSSSQTPGSGVLTTTNKFTLPSTKNRQPPSQSDFLAPSTGTSSTMKPSLDSVDVDVQQATSGPKSQFVFYGTGGTAATTTTTQAEVIGGAPTARQRPQDGQLGLVIVGGMVAAMLVHTLLRQ